MDLKLIIFAKNLRAGNVKTRIAVKIGAAKALNVYKILLINILELVQSLPGKIHPILYFSESLEEKVIRDNFNIEVKTQKGKDLGERMANAISNELNSGTGRICLIGTDIYGLNKEIILQAFEDLSESGMVLGPAKDGGYYLIGMEQYYPEVFSGISWGQSTVMADTIKCINSLGISYSLLPVLGDVDEFEDIPEELRKKLNLS